MNDRQEGESSMQYETIESPHSGAKLTCYLLDPVPFTMSDGKRPAVVIFPGGGYGYCSDREGEPIAARFLAAGMHAFILWYSCGEQARHPAPLLDASWAVATIRERFSEAVEEHSIAACGFSAGGHLAASLGAHWQEPAYTEPLGIAPGSNRPDALLLCYSVISSGEAAHVDTFQNLLGPQPPQEALAYHSVENHVTGKMPPAFIWHTMEDSLVPVENALLLASAMQKQAVPFELHIYTKGDHGLSTCDEQTAPSENYIVKQAQSWIPLSIQWLRGQFAQS